MCLISSDADLATLDHLESLRNRGAVPISKSQGELHSRKRRSYLLSASPLALVLVRLDYSAPNCPDDLRIADQDADDLADDDNNADYDADVDDYADGADDNI